ncbi:MAG: hypothetical protein LBL13_08195 [Bacteroidales bacterium]|jgi:hypothetical protein|nr:hypothetical protein [Bacteroidales bacterium]
MRKRKNKTETGVLKNFRDPDCLLYYLHKHNAYKLPVEINKPGEQIFGELKEFMITLEKEGFIKVYDDDFPFFRAGKPVAYPVMITYAGRKYIRGVIWQIKTFAVLAVISFIASLFAAMTFFKGCQ